MSIVFYYISCLLISRLGHFNYFLVTYKTSGRREEKMIISASSRKGNTSETTRKKIAVIVHKSGTKGVECFSKL